MTPHPQPKTRGIHCVGRVINENESPCPAWCIYEQEKIWCACYDAKNIHQWWGIQNLFYLSGSGAGAVLDELERKFIVLNRQGNFRPWNIGHIRDVIAELRSKTKEPSEMTERAEEER